jgi:hypothetical protein
MKTYKVTYTAYEKCSYMVASEGVMAINTQTSWQAEQTVKAIFKGLVLFDIQIKLSKSKFDVLVIYQA